MEDLFDLIKDDNIKPTQKLDILEDRINRIIKIVKNLREEKTLLEAKVSALEEDLRREKEELNRFRLGTEEIEKIQGEINKLSEERGLIRTRIGGILRELEFVELN